MTVTAALELLLALLDRAAAISHLLSGIKNEGRDTLTADEWAAIIGEDDQARARLAALIAARKAGLPDPPP